MFSYGSRLYQLLISPYQSYISRNVIELRHLPVFHFDAGARSTSKTFSAISSDENNVNKHTTFCDVRKLFKDRSKPSKWKVMFLTSNKIEYC